MAACAGLRCSVVGHEVMSSAAALKATSFLIRRATAAAATTTSRRFQHAAIIGPATTTNINASSIVVGSCPSALGVMAQRRPFSTRPAEQRSDDGDNESGGELGSDGAVGAAQGRGELLEMKPWDSNEKRTGVLAMKVGMMPIFDRWGVRHAVTVLQLDECDVIQVKRNHTDGYTSMQLGVGERKAKNVNKPLTHHFSKAGVKPKRKVMEFRVTEGSLLPVGFRLRAQHFVPGQLVDVCGISKGKGFQGVMKRWGFAGQAASHGVSKTHRHMGSTGQCQDPGRVFKGKKMPGRMGNDRVTVQNLKILKIDPARELLFVKGHVPGQNGGYIRVTDAVRGPNFPEDPPFPSFVSSSSSSDGAQDTSGELWCPHGDVDPLKGDEE